MPPPVGGRRFFPARAEPTRQERLARLSMYIILSIEAKRCSVEASGKGDESTVPTTAARERSVEGIATSKARLAARSCSILSTTGAAVSQPRRGGQVLEPKPGAVEPVLQTVTSQPVSIARGLTVTARHLSRLIEKAVASTNGMERLFHFFGRLSSPHAFRSIEVGESGHSPVTRLATTRAPVSASHARLCPATFGGRSTPTASTAVIVKQPKGLAAFSWAPTDKEAQAFQAALRGTAQT